MTPENEATGKQQREEPDLISCPTCLRHGVRWPSGETCETCHGSGRIQMPDPPEVKP